MQQFIFILAIGLSMLMVTLILRQSVTLIGGAWGLPHCFINHYLLRLRRMFRPSSMCCYPGASGFKRRHIPKALLRGPERLHYP
eukprot:6796720-Pyramimonas_sp.AAC.1